MRQVAYESLINHWHMSIKILRDKLTANAKHLDVDVDELKPKDFGPLRDFLDCYPAVRVNLDAAARRCVNYYAVLQLRQIQLEDKDVDEHYDVMHTLKMLTDQVANIKHM
jgi:hypothetical protein